jgi:hypothetical protein
MRDKADTISGFFPISRASRENLETMSALSFGAGGVALSGSAGALCATVRARRGW